MKYIIGQANGRTRAIDAVRGAEMGTVIEVGVVSKSREQEEKYHAMIADIAKQWRFCDRIWDKEDMKRLCLDQFRRDTVKDPDFAELWKNMGQIDMCPSIDGSGVVALGIQSRRLPKKLATAFIEWLFALGAEHLVKWTDPNIVPVEAYDQSRA
ncbi:MAG: recombination protein NinB [Gallionella sp.]|nr:recombination protein NinB [Gallionella sp.]